MNLTPSTIETCLEALEWMKDDGREIHIQLGYEKYQEIMPRIDAALTELRAVVALPVNEYQIEGGHGPRDTQSITLKRQPQRSGPDKWAINRGSSCLSKEGYWEYEPLPSSRDDDFLSRCRFDSPQEALALYAELKAQRPTPSP